MDASFLSLFCPAEHVVLARRLRPPCLYDLLALEIADNPVGQILAIRERPPTADAIIPEDLLQACEILSNPAGAALQPGFYQAVTQERIAELALLSFEEACVAFDRFVADTCQIPDTWDADDNGKEMGAPWIFAVSLKLELKLPTRTEKQIWTMPLGKLFWTALTISELEGSAEILTAEMAEVVREIQRRKEEKRQAKKEVENG